MISYIISALVGGAISASAVLYCLKEKVQLQQSELEHVNFMLGLKEETIESLERCIESNENTIGFWKQHCKRNDETLSRKEEMITHYKKAIAAYEQLDESQKETIKHLKTIISSMEKIEQAKVEKANLESVLKEWDVE